MVNFIFNFYIFEENYQNYHVIVLIIRRWFCGTASYRISELADLAKVTKRTIDYYTNIGLLRAERSNSNYRFYSLEALEQLHYIEHCKRKGMSLEEIKGSLHHENPRSLIEYSLNYENNDLVQKIDELNNHLKDIMQLIKKLDEKDNQVIKSHLTPESLTAMHSLLTVFS